QFFELVGIGLRGVENGLRLRGDSPVLQCLAELRGGRGQIAVFFQIVNESKSDEVRRARSVDIRLDGNVMTPHGDLFGLRNPGFERGWRNGAQIDIEEGDIVVGDLVKEDEEVHQVRVRLLPERFFAAAKEIVQKSGDAVSQFVGVEIALERVVAVFGVETDFNVILAPAVAVEYVFHLVAEVAFDFQDQATDAFVFLVGFIGKNLLGKRIHAATGFARADSAENGNSGEQSPFRNGEPSGSLGGHGLAGVMNLADDEEECVSFAGVRVTRKTSR